MSNLDDSLERLLDKLDPSLDKIENLFANWIDKSINWWEDREERKRDNPPPETP